MAKAMILGGMLIFGMLLGNGWWNAGELVYDRVQKVENGQPRGLTGAATE